MRVLYISAHTGADYLDNMVFHGMRSLLGSDCVDVNKQTLMYPGDHIGFHSLYRKLPDIDVDRTDIAAKVRSHYFDRIVYGSIHRSSAFIEDATAVYSRRHIALIDGEDDYGISALHGSGVYFKRELPEGVDALPIQFCIPKEMILPLADLPPKTRLLAPCDPRDRSTYIYYGESGEANYYRQYAESYFGYTMKKGGWDCCRHYEILAAGALPYFANLEAASPSTMFRFSRPLFYSARMLYDTWGNGMGAGESHARWYDLMQTARRHLLDTMTTEAMAKYVLEMLN